MRRAPLLALLLAGCVQREGDLPDGPGEPEAVELPACAGRIARAMWTALVPVADRGTVPLEQVIARDASVEGRVYVSGPEIFPRMAELVSEARVEVTLQFYKWEPGTDATETILGGLAAIQDRRRAEGDRGPPVDVWFTVDTSPIAAGAPSADELMPAIVDQVAGYAIDPAEVAIHLAIHERKAANSVATMHVKSAVVDGRIAMLTGANPEAQHDFAEPWHDTGWVMGGSLVAGVLADFDHSWERSQLWVCPAGVSWGETCTAPTSPIAHAAPAAADTLDVAACDALLLTRAGAAFPGNDIDNPQDQAMLAAFGAAERELHLETPNLNDDAAKDALVAAALRGVEVRVILSKGFNDTAEELVGGTNADNVAELYERLAEAGAGGCGPLQIRWYSHDGVEPVFGNVAYANHTKYTSIDREVVVFGEMNMDTPSWNYSHELNVAVDDGWFAGLIERDFFAPDWERAIPVAQCGGP